MTYAIIDSEEELTDATEEEVEVEIEKLNA